MSVRPYRDKQGNIVPRKWIIDYYPQGRKGKQVKKIVEDVNEAEAKTLELALRRQYNQKPVEHDPKVIDAWPNFLKAYARDHAPSTVTDMQTAALKLMPHFGQWHLSRLTKPLFEQYLDTRSKDTWRPPIRGKIDPDKTYLPPKPIGKGRVNTELKYFNCFLNWCVQEGKMLTLPFVIPKFKRLPKKRPVLPSLDQVDKLLPFLHDEARLAVLLYHDAGLRRHEALTITAEQCLMDDDALNIIGKGSKQRFVILKTDRLRAALKERLKKIKTGPLLINERTGEPLKDLRRAILGAADRAGVTLPRIYNHLFRHAHATRSLEAGEDLEHVRQDLGHADLSTTQGYLHLILDSRREGAKKFDAHLARKRLMNEKTK